MDNLFSQSFLSSNHNNNNNQQQQTLIPPSFILELNSKVDKILKLLSNNNNNNNNNGNNNINYIGNDLNIILFILNCNIRIMNKRNIKLNEPILPLYKINEGIGNFNNLKESPISNSQPLVGWLPIDFPLTFNKQLTSIEISSLSRFYNCDFDIKEFDNLILKNKKFYDWIHNSKFNKFN